MGRGAVNKTIKNGLTDKIKKILAKHLSSTDFD
jgi:hypothetical protein